MKIRIEQDYCTSCNLCWKELPAIFGHNEDNLVTLKKNKVPKDLEDKLRLVADICPGECIILEE